MTDEQLDQEREERQPKSKPTGFESAKLLGLLKNPANSQRLSPKDDWLYGAIGIAAALFGFVFWIWGVQQGFKRSFALFGDLIFGALAGSAPVGRFLWLGLVSAAVLFAATTVIGNRMGARKRNWTEIAAYQGGTQVWFGAAYFVCGIVALAAWKFSILLMGGLLLGNLTFLASHAADLHEVAGEKKFSYLVASVGSYAVVVYALFAIF